MDRLSDDEIGEMWTNNYSRRHEEDSWLLLNALVNIIRGNNLIISRKEGGDYSKRLKIFLQQCKIPIEEYLRIEQSKTPQRGDVNEKYRL